MNRGVVQSSPVQQMMAAGNPNWWNINHTMRPPLSHQQPSSSPNLFSNNNNTNFVPPYPYPYSYPYPYPPTNSSLPFPPNQELPESWSQLLMGEEEKKMGNWEEQMLISEVQNGGLVEVKQESSSVNSYMYGHNNNNSKNNNEEFQAAKQQTAANWSHHHHHQIVPPPAAASSSSPKSCVTSFSSNMLDFSTNNTDAAPPRHHPPPDRSSECNSNGGGGAVKKARVQQSTTQSSSTFKVRKEKLGDRITALHQLVSPFGKTDTASVLLEAIGYIRFLQNQIEALSLPYLGGGSPNIRQQHSVQGEKNCLFPEDPGQLLNESCLKRKATSEQDSQELLEVKKDLRSRGLCLVPVSCTLQVGSENGADYWAPALGGAAAGFR